MKTSVSNSAGYITAIATRQGNTEATRIPIGFYLKNNTECEMATSELSAWDGCCPSQLKIVLLGGRNCGKSSVGNLLLGKEEFVTRERTTCSRRSGAAAGRWLTVVDTPGWWCDFGVQDTSALVKREIVSSVSLCSPGPHVFLIAVKASSAFSERRRRAVEEHVALLGERVWGHCVVVFTRAGGSGLAGAAELVHAGGEALGWLSEKCSRRGHSVDLSGDAGVAGLLEKIRQLAGENGNRVFEMPESLSRVAAEGQRGAEEGAQRRLMRVKEHRSLMRERLQPMTDIRVVLVGAKGSGKTSALNTILGRRCLQPPGRTARCQVGAGVVFGRRVTVVDTPGWWMNYFADESTAFDRRELALGSALCPPGPHVFLLVIRADRAFTETHGRAVREHLRLIGGERVWGRVVVLFGCGDWLAGTTTERYIESEGEPLRGLVERCGNRYHTLNNKTRGDGFQVRELIGKIELMFAGRGDHRHHEVERSVMEHVKVKMRGENERAEERLMRKERRRQMARSQLERLNPLPEMRLVLVGGRKTGKTTSCAEKRGKIRSKVVTVLDTPGGLSLTSDLLGAPSSCAILLVVNVSSSFTGAHGEALEKQLEAAGGQMWSRAAVLFSHGDWLGDTSVERRIESEGEPLRRLVEKCGNRYHVLDNRRARGGGAQVDELIQLMEETLAEERLTALRGGDRMWRSVQEPDTVTLCEEDLKVNCDVTESATCSIQRTGNCSDGADAGGQIVAVPAAGGRAGLTLLGRDTLVSILASVLSGRNGLRCAAAGQQGVTAHLPLFFPADDPHRSLSRNGGSRVRPFSPAHPTVLFILPQTRSRAPTEDSAVVDVHPLCHPALRERTLRRLAESGGLQLLIDQWGHSSLEELEAFIDTYFEMVWEKTMGSFPTAEPESAAVEEEDEVLSSIDRKLSKLELLDEIRGDLAKLRESLERSWMVIQELRDKSKGDPNNTC
ncbi:GTPase IMAP family member 8-like isoform X1 [Scophthalmus maximus]|uniref:GTPase IMAP family member 8-like isoform X1 n=1 Tax=Scophthalmus maximus TaxID=52904 RepID=UPI001FA8875E|nr:GTPase IMAP family member 8-like isoform X1 [Scophthalmus maximus]